MEKNCKYCDELFNAQRSTAEFCSTNCRVKYNNNNPKTYAIYCLKNPLTDKIFYVGCSCQNLKVRLTCHIGEYGPHRKERPSRKQAIIQEILAAEKRPIIEVLEKVDAAEAKDAEQRWIKKLNNQGEKLTNFEITGKGPYLQPLKKEEVEQGLVFAKRLTEKIITIPVREVDASKIPIVNDEPKQWEEPKSAASGSAVKVTINKGAYMNDAIKKKLGLP